MYKKINKKLKNIFIEKSFLNFKLEKNYNYIKNNYYYDLIKIYIYLMNTKTPKPTHKK